METLITSRELAEYLKIKQYTVREMTRRGELPHLRLGTVIRYRLSDVLAQMEQSTKTDAQEKARAV